MAAGQRSVKAGSEGKGEGGQGGHEAGDEGIRWIGGCPGDGHQEPGSHRTGTAMRFHCLPWQPHTTNPSLYTRADLWALTSARCSWGFWLARPTSHGQQADSHRIDANKASPTCPIAVWTILFCIGNMANRPLHRGLCCQIDPSGLGVQGSGVPRRVACPLSAGDSIP